MKETILITVLAILGTTIAPMAAPEDYPELIQYMDTKDYKSAIQYISGLMIENDDNMTTETEEMIEGTWRSENGVDVLRINLDGTCVVNEKECTWKLAGPANDYGVFSLFIYPDIYEGKDGWYDFVYEPSDGSLRFNGYTSGMDPIIESGRKFYKDASTEASTNTLDPASPDTVKRVQEALNAAGYDCGNPDGSKGPHTTEVIQRYQNEKGLEATGEIDDQLLVSLGLLSSFTAPEGDWDFVTVDITPENFSEFFEFVTIPKYNAFGEQMIGNFRIGVRSKKYDEGMIIYSIDDFSAEYGDGGTNPIVANIDILLQIGHGMSDGLSTEYKVDYTGRVTEGSITFVNKEYVESYDIPEPDGPDKPTVEAKIILKNGEEIRRIVHTGFPY